MDQGASWWGNLGDWLGPENSRNDATLLWEAYFIYDLDIMRRVADLLGYKEDADRYAQPDLHRPCNRKHPLCQ